MSRFGEIDVRVNVKDVLDSISEDEVIEFYGEAALLDKSGKEVAAEYFGFEEENDD